jgi:branched-chain amino acid transport system ATP-binding protein
MTQLSVTNIDSGYGDLQVLSDVDLHVDEGEYVCIIGPNGAGKSTMLKTIFGLNTLMGGTITYQGEDISDKEPNEIVRVGMNFVPQTGNIFPPLTVRENLQMGGYILDDVPEELIAEIFEYFPPLAEREDSKAGMLSGGQRQMLAIGRALMLDPDLLLLDEPSAGLSPDLVDKVFDHIDEINRSGTSILIVEQNAKEALRRSDRGYVLVSGENQFEGPSEELLNDEEVRQEFLSG